MIYLITGVPGSGKTLYLLQLVEKLRVDTGRPVFHQHASGPGGIPDLSLPWEPLEGREWFNVPDGSVVVLDEAQHVFPNRKPGSQVPDRVRHLETHRHRGFDLYLVSQRPGLVDSHVRALVGKHTHVERVFGQPRAKLLEWESRLGDPNSNSDRELGTQTRWEYPTDIYGWYKSAEVHTVKEAKPWKKIILAYGALAAAPLLLGVGIWSIYSRYAHKGEAAAQQIAESPERSNPAQSLAPGRDSSVPDLSPTVPGVPWTAPFYGQYLKVRSVPRLTGCMHLVIDGKPDVCRCSTQQGTDAGLTVAQCLDVVKTGSFDPMAGDVNVREENIRRLEQRGTESPTVYSTPSPDRS